jgi:hypothetical protein
MAGRFASSIAVLIVLIQASCSVAPSPFKGTWIASPHYHEVDNSLCMARLTPQKGNNAYYAFFMLTVMNQSDTVVTIDWNTSRYVHNGTPQGMLVFDGIDPEAVKNRTVPLEHIAPGGQLERNLMPMRLIAWSPIREKNANPRGISAGMLPAGKNGILLSLRQAENRVTIPLSVFLSLEKQP